MDNRRPGRGWQGGRDPEGRKRGAVRRERSQGDPTLRSLVAVGRQIPQPENLWGDSVSESKVLVPRFFRRREHPPSSGDSGFLPDIESPYGRAFSKHSLLLDEVLDARCVVILGEPGIGKSTVLEQRRAQLPADAVFVDLRFERADQVLEQPAITEWQSGVRTLHLVIDSLDESTDPDFARLLIGKLRNGPVANLRLELACRHSEWPPVLEKRLPELFEGSYECLVVEPLRRRDVAELCQESGVDPGPFLKVVKELNLEALARVPLTLELLLSAFPQSGELPRRTRDLYEQACLTLCDEQSDTKRSTRRTTALDSRQRLDVASAIAALSVFCHLPVLSMADLTSALGQLPEPRRPTEDAVEQALASGLFTTRGAGHWGWTHQTYAEYLAARWADSAKLSRQQLRQLVFHPENPDVLVPQLSGVAAWLASFTRDIPALLANHAPHVFIASDTTHANDSDRAAATDGLLARSEDLTAPRSWASPAEYARLHHPGLAGQLEAIVTDAQRQPRTRRLALEIAAANRLDSLFEAACRIAQDRAAPAGLRAEAVETAIASGTRRPAEELSGVLRPLAQPDASDPDEDVRATVLEWLWPDHLSSGELFGLITKPQRAHYIGRYLSFVSRLPSTLQARHLADALAWVERNTHRHEIDDCLSFEELAHKICRLAADHLTEPVICLALAKAVHRRLGAYKTAFGRGTATDGAVWALGRDARRALVQAIVESISMSQSDAHLLLHPHLEPPFVTEEDIQWLLEAWSAALGEKKGVWAALVSGVVAARTRIETLEAALIAAGDDIVSELLPIPRWIELGSVEEQRQRQLETNRREWEDRDRGRAAAAERQAEASRALVERALAADGTARQWTTLIFRFWQENRNQSTDLAALLGLDGKSSEAPREVLDAARRFVTTCEALPERWLHDQGSVYPDAVAGYLTLRFLLRSDAQWLSTQGSRAFDRWTSAILGYPTYCLHGAEDRAGHATIISKLFEACPRHALATLETVLRRPYEPHLSLGVLQFLPARSDVSKAVRRRLLRPSNAPDELGELLQCLLRIDLDSALAAGSAVLARRPARYEAARLNGGNSRTQRRGVRATRRAARAVRMAHQEEVCVRLLEHSSARAVQAVWEATQRNRTLAVRVWSRFPGRHLRAPWGTGLAAALLADLYLWLERNVASERQSADRDAWLDDGLQFRLRLLDELANRGSAESMAEFRRLARELPDDANARARIGSASERFHEESWRPIAPGELMQLALSPDRRLVQTDVDLLQAVLEALDSYQIELQGETPAVVDLWNVWTEGGTRRYRPKDENDFSDHLSRFLSRALRTVVVNREVEIRPSEGNRTGQRTDLLIQAVHPDTGKRTGLVIEVKGCWNPDLETDLEEQLVRRYLTGGTLRCGLYLIGWFASASWDRKDQRQRVTARRDREKLMVVLSERSSALSAEGRHVRVRVIDAGIGDG